MGGPLRSDWTSQWAVKEPHTKINHTPLACRTLRQGLEVEDEQKDDQRLIGSVSSQHQNLHTFSTTELRASASATAPVATGKH